MWERERERGEEEHGVRKDKGSHLDSPNLKHKLQLTQTFFL